MSGNRPFVLSKTVLLGKVGNIYKSEEGGPRGGNSKVLAALKVDSFNGINSVEVSMGLIWDWPKLSFFI